MSIEFPKRRERSERRNVQEQIDRLVANGVGTALNMDDEAYAASFALPASLTPPWPEALPLVVEGRVGGTRMFDLIVEAEKKRMMKKEIERLSDSANGELEELLGLDPAKLEEVIEGRVAAQLPRRYLDGEQFEDRTHRPKSPYLVWVPNDLEGRNRGQGVTKASLAEAVSMWFQYPDKTAGRRVVAAGTRIENSPMNDPYLNASGRIAWLGSVYQRRWDQTSYVLLQRSADIIPLSA